MGAALAVVAKIKKRLASTATALNFIMELSTQTMKYLHATPDSKQALIMNFVCNLRSTLTKCKDKGLNLCAAANSYLPISISNLSSAFERKRRI